MIDQTQINREWISQQSQKYNADPSLVEKVNYALLLLEGLAKQDFYFVFKGGTALMLLQNSAKRLSIDIDILMDEKLENEEEIFQKIADKQGFSRFKIQERKSTSKLEKMHVKFYYPSAIDGQEQNVILDILFENSPYQSIGEIDIKSDFVPQEGTPISVKVPSKDDLLGDKLTAFAPETTGIPYMRSGNSMNMEIIKQLYDIGNLFDELTDFDVIKATFAQVVKHQLNYRGLAHLSEKEVLEDIQNAALCIMSKGKLGDADFKELQEGIKRIKNFIHSDSYRIEAATISAAKAAYLATCLLYNSSPIKHFTDPQEIKDWEIADAPYNKLNKLKKSNPEAFYYAYKMYEILNSHKTI